MRKLSPRQKNLIFLAAINLSLILFAIIYTLFFSTRGEGEGFVCYAKKNLLIYCPGCGGSRSLSAFLRFDILESFRLYPPIPISFAVVLDYDARMLHTILRKHKKPIKYYSFLLIPISIILTFLIRNILLHGFEIDTLGDFSRFF